MSMRRLFVKQGVRIDSNKTALRGARFLPVLRSLTPLLIVIFATFAKVSAQGTGSCSGLPITNPHFLPNKISPWHNACAPNAAAQIFERDYTQVYKEIFELGFFEPSGLAPGAGGVRVPDILQYLSRQGLAFGPNVVELREVSQLQQLLALKGDYLMTIATRDGGGHIALVRNGAIREAVLSVTDANYYWNLLDIDSMKVVAVAVDPRRPSVPATGLNGAGSVSSQMELSLLPTRLRPYNLMPRSQSLLFRGGSGLLTVGKATGIGVVGALGGDKIGQDIAEWSGAGPGATSITRGAAGYFTGSAAVSLTTRIPFGVVAFSPPGLLATGGIMMMTSPAVMETQVSTTLEARRVRRDALNDLTLPMSSKIMIGAADAMSGFCPVGP